MQEDESVAVADRTQTDPRANATYAPHGTSVPAEHYPQASATAHAAGAPAMSGQEPFNAALANADGLLSDYAFQALQLRAQPFQNGVVEGELFADEQTYAQINEIRQAVISGETLLLLLGEQGAGKTTLLKQLTQQSGQRLQYFSVRGGENYTTHNLFNGILDSWKLTTPSELEETLKELIYSLQATQERNTIVIIMIDDVDHIPTPELRLLLSSTDYINSDEDTLLRLVFSGEPAFENRIPDLLPEGSEMPYSALMVEPFHASRAAPYLEFRLNQAGYYEEFPFDERQINAIANDAYGLPGHINAIAAETLNTTHSPFSDAGGQRSISKRSLMPGSLFAGFNGKRIGKILLGLCGLGLIIAGLLYKAPKQVEPDTYQVVDTKPVNSSPSDTASQAKLTMPDESINKSRSSAQTSTSANAAAGVASATNSVTGNQTPDANSDKPPVTNQPSAAQAGAAAQQASTGTTAAQAANNSKPALTKTPASVNTSKAVTPEPSTVASNDDLKAAAAEINAAVSGSAEAPAAETPAKTSAPETTNSNATAAAESIKKPAEAAKARTTAPTTVADAKPAEKPSTSAEPASTQSANQGAATAKTDTVNGLESANWVLLQDPKLYTVQMSASTDRPSVASFLRRGKLEAPNSIFSFQRNGKTWYALVHGLYPNIREARTAIEKMSKSARSNQPWIREIGRIQQALKDQ